MYITFSSPSYIKIIKTVPRGGKLVSEEQFITILPEDKIELSTDVLGLQIQQPSLSARVDDMKVVNVENVESDLLSLYRELEDKCEILGITPEDYIKQNKPSLF